MAIMLMLSKSLSLQTRVTRYRVVGEFNMLRISTKEICIQASEFLENVYASTSHILTTCI